MSELKLWVNMTSMGNLSTIHLFINQQSLNSLSSMYKLLLSEQLNWIVARADWKITSWLLISDNYCRKCSSLKLMKNLLKSLTNEFFMRGALKATSLSVNYLVLTEIQEIRANTCFAQFLRSFATIPFAENEREHAFAQLFLSTLKMFFSFFPDVRQVAHLKSFSVR